MEEINENDLPEYSPRDIILNIFTKEAGAPGTNQMLVSQDDLKVDDITYIYEILISILLEAVDCAVSSLKNYDFTNFSEELLLYFSPWFHSLGFNLYVHKYDLEYKDLYDNYYCKILINNSCTGEESFFDLNSITDRSYYFLLNGGFIKKNSLKDIFSIFRFNSSIYTVYFDLYKYN